jgi:hypothetical protein
MQRARVVALRHAPRQHDKGLQFNEPGALVVIDRQFNAPGHRRAEIIARPVAGNSVLAAHMVQGVHKATRVSPAAKFALVPVPPVLVNCNSKLNT